MPEPSPSVCPDCGTPLSSERWAAGLCLPCLADLARLDSAAEDRLMDDASDTRTLAQGHTDPGGAPGRHSIESGAVLGERYRIRSHLGAGGMGDVWRAFDLKLRVDVALKSLKAELTEEPEALESLREEVRIAREVISPNVCRVFDLQEVAGREWISMEYVDGKTLAEILHRRGPLALDEARELASQFLAGLEAIHDAGLVHRDIKPENLMVTRTGRVVVMDFGIAKSLEEGKSGVVSGTPAYMSPEQSRGLALDARADVFAAGVVLAEMVAPEGVATFDARRAVWRGIHASEPLIADTPWARLIAQAVAAEPERRPASAAVLARALEEVTLRAAGDEDAHPYPGLAAFTEDEATYFFGRELEVEALWKKLRRPQLQALIAPSGAGKSSFLRAGVLATVPDGWRAVLATPGRRPFTALAHAMVPELVGDGDSVAGLLSFEDPEVAIPLLARWRQEHRGALVILDQFEELFTQNPPEVQAAFADLVGRLPLEADVHVLVAMREDFHFHCQRFEALAPVFSDTTPLGPLGGSALRRALVQPALKCGYRFEDDSLVDEMLAELAHERGALPLLAFAAAQLWQQRDRETGRLTRRAYEETGGVGGALGRHAEATLERIGEDRQPIVRELFRNLVTAQGTRAARDRHELLSVFDAGDRAAAGEILDTLVDARLLVSYEEPTEAGDAATRLEIVHESLLAKWPRLVRWRTQDAEGAQLRDDLRQSAQRWQERGRPEDLLWTGTSYQEFRIWRERYPGGLSQSEEEFARAMTAKAERRKRRRRLAVATAFALVLAVLAVVGGFWRRAVGESRRAEAQKLIALGQLELESFSTATLAYATRSIEVADSLEGRKLALEALWRRPPTWRVNTDSGLGLSFNPDQRWLAQGRFAPGDQPKIRLTSWDGQSSLLERIYDQPAANADRWLTEDLFLAHSFRQQQGAMYWEYSVWSASAGRSVAQIFGIPIWPDQLEYFGWNPDAGHFVFLKPDGAVELHGLEGDGPRVAGRIEAIERQAAQTVSVSASGRWIATADDGEITLHPLREGRVQAPRTLGRHEGVSWMIAGPAGSDLLMTRSPSGEINLWKPSSAAPRITLRGPAGQGAAILGPGGSMVLVQLADPAAPGLGQTWVATLDRAEPVFRNLGSHRYFDPLPALDPVRRQAGLATRDRGFLWARLDGPAGASPVELHVPTTAQINGIAFGPTGEWLAGTSVETYLWSLARPHSWTVERGAGSLAFDPRGRWLATQSPADDGSSRVEVWSLDAGAGPPRELWRKPGRGRVSNLAVSADGERLLVGVRFPAGGSGPLLLSLEDGTADYLPDGFQDQMFGSLSADGRFAAASGGQFVDPENLIKVWDLDLRTLVATMDPDEKIDHCCTAFTADNRLLWAGVSSGLWRWSFETGENELLYEGPVGDFSISADARQVLMRLYDDDSEPRTRKLVRLDLESGEAIALTSHGERVRRAALGPEGRIVASADQDGVVRVGLADDSEPHLLLGGAGTVESIAVDPLGRWVVSAGEEIRFWPMPDFGRPPTHLLPRDRLVALLRAQTNLRLVRNPEQATRWKLEWAEFPGWQQSPPRW